MTDLSGGDTVQNPGECIGFLSLLVISRTMIFFHKLPVFNHRFSGYSVSIIRWASITSLAGNTTDPIGCERILLVFRSLPFPARLNKSFAEFDDFRSDAKAGLRVDRNKKVRRKSLRLGLHHVFPGNGIVGSL